MFRATYLVNAMKFIVEADTKCGTRCTTNTKFLSETFPEYKFDLRSRLTDNESQYSVEELWELWVYEKNNLSNCVGILTNGMYFIVDWDGKCHIATERQFKANYDIA